jgi:hypothetical protein
VQRCGLNASGSQQQPVAGSCKDSDERLDSIKHREFDYLNDH